MVTSLGGESLKPILKFNEILRWVIAPTMITPIEGFPSNYTFGAKEIDDLEILVHLNNFLVFYPEYS